MSIANVTGYSVITGLCYALEPLMSQALGAGQFHEVGIQLQRGVTILLACTLPICAMWCFMEPILILLGQDPAVAHMAGLYIVHLVPDAFIICFVMPLRIYLTSQVRKERLCKLSKQRSSLSRGRWGIGLPSGGQKAPYGANFVCQRPMSSGLWAFRELIHQIARVYIDFDALCKELLQWSLIWISSFASDRTA